MRRALALAALFVLLAAPAGQDPLTFALNGQGDSGHHISDPVDQQTWCGDCVGTDYTSQEPWAVNPHDNWPFALPLQGQQAGCSWDSDDRWSYVSTGTILAAGASATVQECRYSDLGGYPRLLMDVGISSPSDALLVSIRWEWDAGSVTRAIPAVFDPADHRWHYFECLSSPDPTGTLVPIPNSHDGTAVPTLITITVTNPTGQKVGRTGGYIEGGLLNGLSRGC